MWITTHRLQLYINWYPETSNFFDVTSENKNFYCILLAEDKKYFDKYEPWYECEDGEIKSWKTPFCINNIVSREEAIMTLLKSSNLITQAEVNSALNSIENWTTSTDLSEDVRPKNQDWTINKYYPYLEKALEIELIEYDTNWNEKNYKLLEEKDWKIRPKEWITREELLYMSYIILKLNSCETESNGEIALKIDVYDKSCSNWETQCNLSNLESSDDTYDFDANVISHCDEWIDEESWYNWWFINITNGESFTKNWKYLDNIKFQNSWIWKTNLRVVDKCSKKSEVSIFINVWNDNSMLSVNADLDKLTFNKWFVVNFQAIASSFGTPHQYQWDFWDAHSSIWKKAQHIYSEDGIYEVKLWAINSNLLYWQSNMFLEISGSIDCNEDSDKDWVGNCDDECPLVFWDSLNIWCPIFYTKCESDCSCPDWYTCNTKKTSTCSDKGFCILSQIESDVCSYNPSNNSIFWNIVCNSSKCNDYAIKFLADLRTCDEVYPAIVSLDGKEIYSTWSIWTSSWGLWKEKETETEE